FLHFLFVLLFFLADPRGEENPNSASPDGFSLRRRRIMTRKKPYQGFASGGFLPLNSKVVG
ncbi:MAG: hypothetical protein SPI25_05855, partial [Dialister sp.]|nr:hypothetical protein [Dialister sp.]